MTHFALFVWDCRDVDVRRKEKCKREIEALYPEYGKYPSDEMVMYNPGVSIGVGDLEERRVHRTPTLESEMLRSTPVLAVVGIAQGGGETYNADEGNDGRDQSDAELCSPCRIGFVETVAGSWFRIIAFGLKP